MGIVCQLLESHAHRRGLCCVHLGEDCALFLCYALFHGLQPYLWALRSRCGCACANSLKSPPRDPRDHPYHPWRGLVHTNHTRCAESRNGCIQRISGPPIDPEIRHVALVAVPAANLKPGTRPEPAPTTHGGYGRNSTGGWLADDPQGVPPRPRMCTGRGATRVAGKRGRGGAGRPVGSDPTSIPALHSCPSGRHRVGRD
jgi:hypothetical protein